MMATYQQSSLVVAVFVVIATMLLFGAYQNQHLWNGNEHTRKLQEELTNLRNGGFVPYFGIKISDDQTHQLVLSEPNVPFKDKFLGTVTEIKSTQGKQHKAGIKKDKTLKQSQLKANSSKAKKQPTNQNIKKSTVGDIDGLFDTGKPPPTINGYTCSDPMCSEWLNTKAKKVYKRFFQKVKLHFPSPNGHCHFMNGTGRSSVALASFPGSGNTWVRVLLERATGVCTGSFYEDGALRGAGFNGEGIATGAVLVAKAHNMKRASWSTNNKTSGCTSAIVLVRNPFDALVSEWNRQKSHNHTGVVAELKNKFYSNPGWNNFVVEKMKEWHQFFIDWVVNTYSNPVLVIRYEDIKTDVVSNVEKMLDFLKFPQDHQQLSNVLAQDIDTFKRKHSVVTIERFTDQQKNIVLSTLQKTLSLLKDKNHGNTLNIEQYLL